MLNLAYRYSNPQRGCINKEVVNGLVTADNCGVESVAHHNQGNRNA